MSGHADGAAVAARAERLWAAGAVAIIVLLVLAAAIGGIRQAVLPQVRAETIDPATLHLAGEFVEANLGTAAETDGSVPVRAIGQQYSFTPPCLVVPAATPVTIRATSADVVHGFLVRGTNVNAKMKWMYQTPIVWSRCQRARPRRATAASLEVAVITARSR